MALITFLPIGLAALGSHTRLYHKSDKLTSNENTKFHNLSTLDNFGTNYIQTNFTSLENETLISPQFLP